ncbi:NADH-cytochrome b5 reductase 1 [Kwoniella heveanensis CBS 569]|uniref:NADH-cytochrome b5 reductase n=1 Tax=Kwoniella heveanensis BCC8398 TaxID=1296120 RepID=A0A1B9GY83_9TREE|nr:NADH-cytochrome b5 reductase 1 [Kwoniella heveanensis BCC8398]OCF45581.1 NADH-cytochrome b5 reductase 1 [Kwoniella heveanensis CBS 569]
MSAILNFLESLPVDAKTLGSIVCFAFIVGYALIAQHLEGKNRKVLDPVEWRKFKLVAKDHLSHNTALYRFGLPKPTDCLGLPVGQHISVAAEINGKQVVRSYTPTTLDDDKGHFDLVVKTYEKGNISRFLSLLTIGQEVQIKGPKGKFHYTANLAPALLMIAGGTGITPMYQIIKSSLKNPADKTKLALIYANVEEDDILLRKELEALQASSNGRFTLYHVLNKPPANWSGGVGFVTKEMIEQHMPHGGVGSPNHGEGHKVLMCGPPPMITAMKGHLAAIGYPAPRTVSKLEDQVFLF